MRRTLTALCLGWAVTAAAHAAEPAKPTAAAPKAATAAGDPVTQLAKQLEPGPGGGEIVWLEGGGQRSFAIFKADTTGAPQGAVIILHDLGQNLAAPEVIAPLRHTLPNFGWSTLSIYHPQLADGSAATKADEALAFSQAMLASAVKFIQDRGIGNIAVAGLGLGAAHAGAFIAQNANSGAKAFIAISTSGVTDPKSPLYVPSQLEKISLPVLDIYGELDMEIVRATATDRAMAAKRSGAAAAGDKKLEPFKQSSVAENPYTEQTGFIAYRQIVIPGAQHHYTGQEELLVKRIVGWLRRHASGATIKQ